MATMGRIVLLLGGLGATLISHEFFGMNERIFVGTHLVPIFLIILTVSWVLRQLVTSCEVQPQASASLIVCTVPVNRNFRTEEAAS